VFLLLLHALACSGDPASAVPVATVSRGELAIVLGVQGELKAVRSESISAPNIRGNLKITLLAEEGKRVSAGDLLVEFDRTDMEKELESAVSRLQIAKTKIAQKEAQTAVRLGAASNEVVKSELDKKRAEMRVTESETVPRVERETAKLDVQEYGLSVEKSLSALRSAELETQAELELLRLEEGEAQMKVDTIERQLGQLSVRAPSDGIVLLTESWRGGKRGKASLGDTMWPGNSIMELPDLAALRVEAWVHEVDAPMVAVGQKVKVIVDARPEAPLIGTVERVSDLAVKRTEESAVKHLQVSVALEGVDPSLKPGMTVRAEIEVDRLPDVLSVPREAVVHDGATAAVWKDGLTGWTRTSVELGRANDSHVVVTTGLAEGDTVALTDPEAGAAATSSAPASAGVKPGS
jgi:HlyD family secretion protein